MLAVLACAQPVRQFTGREVHVLIRDPPQLVTLIFIRAARACAGGSFSLPQREGRYQRKVVGVVGLGGLRGRGLRLLLLLLWVLVVVVEGVKVGHGGDVRVTAEGRVEEEALLVMVMLGVVTTAVHGSTVGWEVGRRGNVSGEENSRNRGKWRKRAVC